MLTLLCTFHVCELTIKSTARCNLCALSFYYCRLCEPQCSNASISVRGDSGLGGRSGKTSIAVQAMYKIHADAMCQSSAGGSTVKSKIDFKLASCYRLLTTGVLDTSACMKTWQTNDICPGMGSHWFASFCCNICYRCTLIQSCQYGNGCSPADARSFWPCLGVQRHDAG